MVELGAEAFAETAEDAVGAVAAVDDGVVDVAAEGADADVAFGSAGVRTELAALVTAVSLAEACAVVTVVGAEVAEGDSDVAAVAAQAGDDDPGASGLLAVGISG